MAPIANSRLKSELPERVRPCRADACSGKDHLELSGTSMAAAQRDRLAGLQGVLRLYEAESQ